MKSQIEVSVLLWLNRKLYSRTILSAFLISDSSLLVHQADQVQLFLDSAHTLQGWTFEDFPTI